MLAASGCGPIFILTFNRSAICGFLRGFVTALGASIGDAFYFMLGLVGALAVVSELKFFMIILDFIGALVLFGLGAHAIKKTRQLQCVTIECSQHPIIAFGNAILLTIINPLIIFYFLAISIQILPNNVTRLPWHEVFIYSLFVLAGSLTVLSAISLFASLVGSCITAKRLRLISGVSGILFFAFGFYLLFDFIRSLLFHPVFALFSR